MANAPVMTAAISAAAANIQNTGSRWRSCDTQHEVNLFPGALERALMCVDFEVRVRKKRLGPGTLFHHPPKLRLKD